MHDPMTVAHEIKYPWWKYKPGDKMWKDGYRDTFITIWHVDPERDGSDDSCGYIVPKLTKQQRERLKVLAWDEARDPYFLRVRGHKWDGLRSEAEALYRGLLLAVADYAHIPLTYEEAARVAARAIHKPECVDDAARFCFEPGYHSNFQEDRRNDREQHFHEMVCGIARWMLKDKRPWYRHPKWHVWHWQIQCHPVQQFKRWAFSRCSRCTRRFAYGETPLSGSWHSAGPRWFRGEKDIWHQQCDSSAKPAMRVQENA